MISSATGAPIKDTVDAATEAEAQATIRSMGYMVTKLRVKKAAAAGVECVSKEDLYRRADVLTIHMILNKETQNFVGASDLALMKPTALFVNTSRAGLVDTNALIAALKAGMLGGAALDVYDREPLPKDDPIRSAPNTLLTPHLGYVMAENYAVSFREAVENIEAWLDGAPKRVTSRAENDPTRWKIAARVSRPNASSNAMAACIICNA